MNSAKYWSVCYDTGHGIYSCNIIYGDFPSARAVAEHHAKRYGYTISGDALTVLSEASAFEYRAKGMPLVNAKEYLKKHKISTKTY